VSLRSSDGGGSRAAFGATEDCEAACYDCLMSYGNQRDHKHLDRKLIKDVSCKWLCDSQIVVKFSDA